ncbi:hypothetical protein HYFRA_00012717 [Hymenoscyphus fraxineus]|uniref:Uncharacterized protein n=1 Tax=Hymenoscyphus fraxineus TaxID=746836 RepID=A0A9N9PMZ3_9HELO|nr:hypothetical protein HYFRA_00012717 [Hymenoscyphus fraxineus]
MVAMPVWIIQGSKSAQVDSIKTANRLLQKNHDQHHIWWRDFAGHNHAAHNVLTRLALGANIPELELGFKPNVELGQRPPPPVDEATVAELATEEGFHNHLSDVKQYANYLAFFEREIDAKGWKEVIQEYCFSRSRTADTILARRFDGAFHPLIHLGLAVEFEQPSILAEALAQATTDANLNVQIFFANAESETAKSTQTLTEERPLVELIHEARANETIRNSAHWEDMQFKMKNGVLKRAEKEIAALAAQFRVTAENLERRAAEMISCCAYFAGAAQRHELNVDFIKNYRPQVSAGWEWEELYKHANADYDDGHVVKFVRALKNGEEVARSFEDGQWGHVFPVKGDRHVVESVSYGL